MKPGWQVLAVWAMYLVFSEVAATHAHISRYVQCCTTASADTTCSETGGRVFAIRLGWLPTCLGTSYHCLRRVLYRGPERRTRLRWMDSSSSDSSPRLPLSLSFAAEAAVAVVVVIYTYT
ncbi:hypothetical protein B0T26DRAFT_732682 [Lasiosphaeria miniovina]|uniref:Secreted protein n=1 Tax=Lasiosphaeria miniovina TaxID=1954250 RepID=A0AA39ZU57_9PEZI|nr:uncharacterized protein B0T26DRAFT_732682 [Lasiosphaeria miniovina]KAK0703784.1 hypothetical protein B0T26DRAFT_732682 [Lasiosphaeria miniovina]